MFKFGNKYEKSPQNPNANIVWTPYITMMRNPIITYDPATNHNNITKYRMRVNMNNYHKIQLNENI